MCDCPAFWRATPPSLIAPSLSCSPSFAHSFSELIAAGAGKRQRRPSTTKGIDAGDLAMNTAEERELQLAMQNSSASLAGLSRLH